MHNMLAVEFARVAACLVAHEAFDESLELDVDQAFGFRESHNGFDDCLDVGWVRSFGEVGDHFAVAGQFLLEGVVGGHMDFN